MPKFLIIGLFIWGGLTRAEIPNLNRLPWQRRAYDSEKAYLLAYLSHISYVSNIGAQNDEDFRVRFSERAEQLGSQGVAYIESRKTHTFLVVLPLRNATLIVIRGTEPDQGIDRFLGDVGTSLDFRPLPIEGREEIKVHRGYYRAAQSVYAGLLNILEHNSSKNIVITGHSLGGAVARPLAYQLAEDGFNISSVYSFGAPRPVDEQFEFRYRAQLEVPQYEIYNEGDPTTVTILLGRLQGEFLKFTRNNGILVSETCRNFRQNSELQYDLVYHETALYMERLYNQIRPGKIQRLHPAATETAGFGPKSHLRVGHTPFGLFRN